MSCSRKQNTAAGVRTAYLIIKIIIIIINIKKNALPPLKGNDVTPSGLLPSPRSRPTGSRIIIIIMVIFKCYFSGELIALT